MRKLKFLIAIVVVSLFSCEEIKNIKTSTPESERFKSVNIRSGLSIIIDTEEDVAYICTFSSVGGGLTLLVDSMGRPTKNIPE